MEEIREKLDDILIQVDILKNLGELIEEYFDDNALAANRDFRNKGTLSHINVEKVADLHKSLENLWDLTLGEKNETKKMG